jgi:hypothetical protein
MRIPFIARRARVRSCEPVFAPAKFVFAPASSCPRMRARSPGARLFVQARAAEPDAAKARPIRRGLEEGGACPPSSEPARPGVASCAGLVNWPSDGELAPPTRRKITRRGAGPPTPAQAPPARRKLARSDARPVAAAEHPLTASPRIRRGAGAPMVRSYIPGEAARPRLPDHALRCATSPVAEAVHRGVWRSFAIGRARAPSGEPAPPAPARASLGVGIGSSAFGPFSWFTQR